MKSSATSPTVGLCSRHTAISRNRRRRRVACAPWQGRQRRQLREEQPCRRHAAAARRDLPHVLADATDHRRCHDDALRRGQVVVRRPVRPASVTARVRLPTTMSTSKSSGSAPFMQPTCTTWWRNPRRCRFDINRVRTMRPPTSMRCRRRSCTRHWSILRNRSPADLPIIRWMLAGLRVVQHEFAWVEECRDRQYRRDLAWEVSPW